MKKFKLVKQEANTDPQIINHYFGASIKDAIRYFNEYGILFGEFILLDKTGNMKIPETGVSYSVMECEIGN